MLIRRAADLRYSDITPKSLYLNRRSFLTGLPAAFLAGKELLAPSARAQAAPAPIPNLVKKPNTTGEAISSQQDVTHYNNYYEFGTSKDEPAQLAQKLKTSPWTVSIEGEVEKPVKLSLDDIMKVAPIEERIYRHRCVEAWSIVVPWAGYSLSDLLKKVTPKPTAKYVAFQSLYDRSVMWGPSQAGIELPYVEGLRLDEAMHPLTFVSVGMYGETLPPQDGAPVRITIPWKYGFKSIKSIVKIKFVAKEPPTTWNITNSHEYGFYSNVNPKVDHPRWTQATERRLGEFRRRPTLMFNGYGDQVASLYNGMDLRKYY
ncbi:MAG TPA: protein-methionine-sulfoxide reductase catalytic subunit MsrP [Bryobacteraceae bacterium]|jgi:sulfoxide reductase catalytic subunit YedY|nr:protein-methionine-sulfoxide reductase catalytic subunit MsrP [Bryobacteraceae bacterium]